MYKILISWLTYPLPSSCKKSIALTCFALLNGCSMAPMISDFAIDYNTAIEDFSNTSAFLNVIRSKKRLPRHFTTVSQITGNLKATAVTGLQSAIGESSQSTKATAGGSTSVEDTLAEGTRSYTPSVQGTFSSEPNFTVAILDTQEFTQGISQPISEDILGLYIGQGWRHDLLAHVFFEGIAVEFINAFSEDVSVYFPNSTDSRDPCAKMLFDEISRNLHIGIRIVEEEKPPTQVATLDEVSASNIAALYAAGLTYQAPNIMTSGSSPTSSRKFSFYIDESYNTDLVDQHCDLQSPSGTQIQVFRFNPTATNPALPEVPEFTDLVELALKALATPGTELAPQGITSGDRVDLGYRELRLQSQRSFAFDNELFQEIYTQEERTSLTNSETLKPSPSVDISVLMRSSEGVIYYTGEYLRNKEKCLKHSNNKRSCKVWIDEQDLFVILESDKTPLSHYTLEEDAYITTNFSGKYYQIPMLDGEGQEHRSMQLLGLIQQLINLNKKAEDLPSSNILNLR